MERRGIAPYESQFALPGGHVEYGETVEDAVLRELWEECSVRGKLVSILGVYSDPKRDPRGQRITTVFVGDWLEGEPTAGDDAALAQWVHVEDMLKDEKSIAFDHSLILKHYLLWQSSERGETYWSSKS